MFAPNLRIDYRYRKRCPFYFLLYGFYTMLLVTTTEAQQTLKLSMDIPTQQDVDAFTDITLTGRATHTSSTNHSITFIIQSANNGSNEVEECTISLNNCSSKTACTCEKNNAGEYELTWNLKATIEMSEQNVFLKSGTVASPYVQFPTVNDVEPQPMLVLESSGRINKKTGDEKIVEFKGILETSQVNRSVWNMSVTIRIHPLSSTGEIIMPCTIENVSTTSCQQKGKNCFCEGNGDTFNLYFHVDDQVEYIGRDVDLITTSYNQETVTSNTFIYPDESDIVIILKERNKPKVTEGDIVSFQGKITGVTPGAKVNVIFYICSYEGVIKSCEIDEISDHRCNSTIVNRCYCMIVTGGYRMYFKTMALTEFSKQKVVATAILQDTQYTVRSNEQMFPTVSCSVAPIANVAPIITAFVSFYFLILKTNLFHYGS